MIVWRCASLASCASSQERFFNCQVPFVSACASCMQIKHQCAKLLVELSQSQDAEIGDGTTGVVILAGNLLSEALRLIEKGLHPLRVADGFEKAAQIAVQAIEKVAVTKDVLGQDSDLLWVAPPTRRRLRSA